MSTARISQYSSVPSRPSSSDLPATGTTRRPSTVSFRSSTASTSSSSLQSTSSSTYPRVQLVPYVHRSSYDSSLSQSERDVLDSTSFDALDLSSKDFEFDDIFTYDKPQKRLPSVMEVSSPKDRDWSNYTLSHYSSATAIRQKANRRANGAGEMYVKNKSHAQKRL